MLMCWDSFPSTSIVVEYILHVFFSVHCWFSKNNNKTVSDQKGSKEMQSNGWEQIP